MKNKDEINYLKVNTILQHFQNLNIEEQRYFQKQLNEISHRRMMKAMNRLRNREQ